MPQRHLVLMVKAPEAGRVKTRLARGLGVVPALRFYRSATGALARRVNGGRRWRTWLAIAPERALRHPVWPSGCDRRGQGRGDLGDRMQRILGDMPPGPVVFVGSDIPGITSSLIASAYRALGGNDIVVGPAPDGGYWLIGFSRIPTTPRIFEGVRWSHSETLSDTLHNARGLAVARLQMLEDVDEPADLAAVKDWSGRVVLPWTIARQNRNTTS